MILRYLKKQAKDEFENILKNTYKLSKENYLIKEKDTYLEAEVNSQHSFDAKVELNYLDNDMILKISLYPDLNGKNIELNYLLDLIKSENIKDVMMERVTEAYYLFQKRYIIKDVTIAKGIKPIKGKNARLILHFEEKIKDKTDEHSGGKVDYKEIHNIINVKKGELLITKIPATKGVPGVTVKGAIIPAEEGKDIEITVLEGVDVLENGRKYVAAIDGHVVFENLKLAVYPIYTVKNVDYSVGNIDFLGTVHVLGDVLADFKIKASKDIVIDGICEDASLYAGENIYINQGIKGKLKNEMIVENDFVIRFAENAKIAAKRNVVVKNYILNCRVKAGDKVVALEGKGQIAGGIIETYNGIECLELGSLGSEKFKVVTGVNPFFIELIKSKEEELEKFISNINKIDEVLKNINLKDEKVKNNENVKKMLLMRKKLGQKIETIKNEINEYKNKIFNKKAKIRVKGVVYSGVDIKICEAYTKVNESMREVLFFLEPKYNQVGWVSLEGLDEINE